MPAALVCGAIRVVVLLVGAPGLEERFEVVLLHFLADHLLQGLRLKHLIRLLLRPELDQERLVNAL